VIIGLTSIVGIDKRIGVKDWPMTSLIAQPQWMAAAAADVAEINSAISAAKAAAAGPTTSLVAAAQDEVSAATAALFGGFGREYQALLRQAAAFHDEFVAALAAAGNAYAAAEATNVGAISAGTAGATTPLLKAMADPVDVITLVMGASGLPIPPADYITGIPPLYINNLFPAGNPLGVNTPEGLYPLTGIKDLTFDLSTSRGVTILNNAIQSAIGSGNTTVNVFGYSQSSVIASIEMQALNPTNTPGLSTLPAGTTLNLTLVGNPANPNGGLLARFPGLSLPSLGLDLFGTATPDNSFPSAIYTIEYDGFGDFPQYPINVLSDVNAFIGILTLHGQYPYVPDPSTQAIQLMNTTVPTQTQYFIIPTSALDVAHQGLPLLDPIRLIPGIGKPIADLLQPDLTVLVDMGYGSTTQGWSPDPPNVPTAFGVLPHIPASVVLGALDTGTQEGIAAFRSDIGADFSSFSNSLSHFSLSDLTSLVGSVPAPTLPPTLISALSSPDNFIQGLQAANTYFANAISGSASDAYATLLPTADVINALFTSVPAYDVNLFASGIQQVLNGDVFGGLQYAFGAPIAADAALLTLFGGFELRVFEHAASSIYDQITGYTPPPPGVETL
jgi:hypothetical protein